MVLQEEVMEAVCTLTTGKSPDTNILKELVKNGELQATKVMAAIYQNIWNTNTIAFKLEPVLDSTAYIEKTSTNL